MACGATIWARADLFTGKSACAAIGVFTQLGPAGPGSGATRHTASGRAPRLDDFRAAAGRGAGRRAGAIVLLALPSLSGFHRELRCGGLSAWPEPATAGLALDRHHG